MKLKILLSTCVIIVLGFSVSMLITKIANETHSSSEQVVEQPVIANLQPTEGVANNTDETAKWVQDEINAIEPQASNLSEKVLKTSLVAYQHALKQGVTHSNLLTIVDYSKPSSERRLWVVNLDSKKVLFNTWVAHGRNSGGTTSESFSNSPESLKSSFGVFVTSEVYSGKHGESLRIQGLEPINNNAYDRSIVFHGASYVSAAIAKTGKIGRSWGCFAVSQDIIPSLIKTIKHQVLVVAYYPDQKWLSKSSFLK